MKEKQMAPLKIQELAPANRATRDRKLRRLKRSVANNSYHINSTRVANGVICEFCSNEAAKKISGIS